MDCGGALHLHGLLLCSQCATGLPCCVCCCGLCSLMCNVIGDEGASAIAEALKSNSTLHELLSVQRRFGCIDGVDERAEGWR